MEQLIKIFQEEGWEIIEQLEEDLLELEKTPQDAQLIARIFRGAHTIKGSAGLTGLDDISGLAHRLEDVLEQVRTEKKPMSRECFETVLKTVDMLKIMLEMVATGEKLPAEEVENAKERLRNFLGLENEPPRTSIVPPTDRCEYIYRVRLSFRPDIFDFGTDPLKLIMELAAKGEVLEVDAIISEVPPLSEIDVYKLYLSWTVVLRSGASLNELNEIFIFVIDDNEIVIEITEAYAVETVTGDGSTGEVMTGEKGGELPIEECKAEQKQVEPIEAKQQPERQFEQSNTIRVDTRRLENVLNFVAELIISQSRVKEMVSKQSNIDEEIFNSFEEVDKVIRRLQEEVMKTSMIPVGGTFTRFQRMVRDIAADQGKEVELVITGQDTELDKRVIEQIADPLKHMIRNSLDHGLELPEEREASGKSGVGRIYLNALHQEGSIVIEVADDGRGIDVDAIYRKAIEKGLVEEGTTLNKEDALKLMLMPGFSTAKQVSDISGRGVGLDVLATNIQQVRGTIEMDSEPGRGTKFSIKLPLTLAIIDGMMVTVGDERYIIPLTSIVEFIKAEPGDIKSVEGSGRVVNMRNEYLPLAALYQLMGLEAKKTEPTEGILVIIQDNRKKVALLVDDILGQEQVVTKSLKENYEQVEGVAGATILGDGRVAIILDVPTVIKMIRKHG